jgi:osmotically-inducible protein OsmY
VEWRYQYIAVQDVIKYLPGVKWVTNLITIKPKLAPVNIETTITAAIERNALLNAKNIQVEATGGKVILRGMVRYYTEREEAERVAWAAPGVISVDNQLKLEWSFGA